MKPLRGDPALSSTRGEFLARKDVLFNWPMFGASGADMSASKTFSQSSGINYQDNIGIIVTWSGTSPVGVLAIEVSNDSLNWIALDFGLPISVSANSGSHNITINQIPYSNIRATYTKTSGTGTLNASLTAKQSGG